MEEKAIKKDSSELRFVYTSLFVCVVIPLVLALIVGHVSGYYEGFGFLGLRFSIPSTLFVVMTPIMYGMFGLSLHFALLSYKSTAMNLKLSLSLWMVTFLFSIAWIVIFFASHMVVLSFVWVAITLSLSVMHTILSFKMNIISAICSLFFTSWLAVISYVLMISLTA